MPQRMSFMQCGTISVCIAQAPIPTLFFDARQ
jgi:hypothetical protein